MLNLALTHGVIQVEASSGGSRDAIGVAFTWYLPVERVYRVRESCSLNISAARETFSRIGISGCRYTEIGLLPDGNTREF